MLRRSLIRPNEAAEASQIAAGYTRRRLLGLLLIGPVVADVSLGSFPSNAARRDENPNLVIRNGWMLRADDLKRLA